MMKSGAGIGISGVNIGANGGGMGAVTRNTYRFVFEGDITVTYADGRVEKLTRFEDTIENLTTTEGRTEMLDKFFKGSGYTAAWYFGLVSNTNIGTPAVGDTAAKITTTTPPNPPTTNDWAESTGYSEGARQTLTFGTAAAASLDASASPCVFTINTSVSLWGAFLVNNSTKGGTSGKIYGIGAFSGVVSLSSGTVTCYPTLTIASS